MIYCLKRERRFAESSASRLHVAPAPQHVSREEKVRTGPQKSGWFCQEAKKNTKHRFIGSDHRGKPGKVSLT